MPRYTHSLDGVTEAMLGGGFFEGWPVPPSPAEHLRILRGSSHVILAIDDDASLYMIDVVCDPPLLSFHEKLGMTRGAGAMLRRRQRPVVGLQGTH